MYVYITYNIYRRTYIPGERSTHISFPSCPARVLRGVQPGWAQIFAVQSYDDVSMKSPVPSKSKKKGAAINNNNTEKDMHTIDEY